MSKNDFRIKSVRRNEVCKIRHRRNDNGVLFYQGFFKWDKVGLKLGRLPQVFYMPTFPSKTTNVIMTPDHRVGSHDREGFQGSNLI